MRKYLKLISAGFALLGVFMMFLPQVTIEWSDKTRETLFVQALFGGKYGLDMGTTYNGVGSGFAGYILLGVAALLLVLCAMVPFFKDHDIFTIIVSSIAVVCLIIGVVLLFLIRRNFALNCDNGLASSSVYVGAGAIAGGSLGGLAIASGLLSVFLDIANQN